MRPKDHSEAELERSFQVAVAWKKKQEKEKEEQEKAVKPKAKLGKKQQLTAKSMDPECMARVARMAHLQHPNLQT